jgi:hypothetical protein
MATMARALAARLGAAAVMSTICYIVEVRVIDCNFHISSAFTQ